MASKAITNIADSTLFDSLNSEIEEPCFIPNDRNIFTYEHLEQAKIGEKVVTSATQINYKVKDGYKVKHNKFNSEYEYCCGSGIDIKVIQGCKDYAEIEVKNWSPQKKPYGTKTVINEVLPRFSHSGGGLMMLVITFLSLLTKAAIQLLEQAGIVIIEVGEKLTSEFYRDLKKLYVLGNQIKKAITKFWTRKAQPKASQPPFSHNTKQTQLDVTSIPNTVDSKQEPHDTPNLTYNQIREFISEYSRLLKQSESERLRALYSG